MTPKNYILKYIPAPPPPTLNATFQVRKGTFLASGPDKAVKLKKEKKSRQCGILNISQPYRPQRPVTGIALLYVDGVCFL
jgi:hypothetical protein